MKKMTALGFMVDESDKVSVWEYGDFLKKVALSISEDSDDKWKIACGIDNIQNDEHVSSIAHARKLDYWERNLQTYVQERKNWNPFSM